MKMLNVAKLSRIFERATFYKRRPIGLEAKKTYRGRILLETVLMNDTGYYNDPPVPQPRGTLHHCSRPQGLRYHFNHNAVSHVGSDFSFPMPALGVPNVSFRKQTPQFASIDF